jgi:AbrB family looped-hinge helix DNA binding protein
MTSKGQLTVPKEIRDRLGREPGAEVELVPSGEHPVISTPASS